MTDFDNLVDRIKHHCKLRPLNEFPMRNNIPLRIVGDDGVTQRGFVVLLKTHDMIPDLCPRDAFIGEQQTTMGVELLSWLQTDREVSIDMIASILEYSVDAGEMSAILWDRQA